MSVRIGTWAGYRLDKITSAKVTKDADAKPDAARVNKHLVSKEVLKDIVACDGKIRVHFYDKTLPWNDTGVRLMPRVACHPFIEAHAILENERIAAVEDFLKNKYPGAVDQAAFRMGKLFDERDYPTVDQLRRKFYVTLDITGVPTSKDVRLNNSDEIFQAKVTAAVEGLWRKLAKPLEHFSNKMNSEEIFRDSAVENLRAVCDMIPALNFLNDPALDAIRQEVEKIIPADAKDLRKDKASREAAGKAASKIVSKVEAMMAAFASAEEDDEAA
jgi:hypothetical protein